jgi:rhodanese-related sulfurtransferase
MEKIDRNELRRWMDEKRNFVLIDALAEEEYHKGHLPGAINIPVDDRRFEWRVLSAEPNKTSPVVVYCASKECQASPKAAKKLEAEGYKQVYDYEAGKADWEKAGFPLVSEVGTH